MGPWGHQDPADLVQRAGPMSHPEGVRLKAHHGEQVEREIWQGVGEGA